MVTYGCENAEARTTRIQRLLCSNDFWVKICRIIMNNSCWPKYIVSYKRKLLGTGTSLRYPDILRGWGEVNRGKINSRIARRCTYIEQEVFGKQDTLDGRPWTEFCLLCKVTREHWIIDIMHAAAHGLIRLSLKREFLTNSSTYHDTLSNSPGPMGRRSKSWSGFAMTVPHEVFFPHVAFLWRHNSYNIFSSLKRRD